MFGVTLGELLNDVAGGQIPSGLLGELLLLKLPEVLNTILPPGVFIGVIWGLGRIYRDQEMTVMRASGFGWHMMLRPLFSMLLPLAAGLLVNGLFIAPKAAQTAQTRLEEAFKTAAEWGFQPGQFHVLQNGSLILYVEEVDKDGRTLRNLFIQQRLEDREQIWTAEQGYYWLDSATGERYLTLENGQITEGGERSLDFTIVRFSRNDLRLPEPQENRQTPGTTVSSSQSLLESDQAEGMAELQWRISPAISVVVLGLLAIPLSHSAPREGRSARILLGFMAYVVYINMLQMSRSWVAGGSVLGALGLWWVHALVAVVTLFWLQRQGRIVGRRT